MLPAVISWFVGPLPDSSVFDGELAPFSCRIAAHLDCGSGRSRIPNRRFDDVIPKCGQARTLLQSDRLHRQLGLEMRLQPSYPLFTVITVII